MEPRPTDETRCVFDDIFAFSHRAICHLRIYRVGEGLVALAVELEDNNGSSVTNSAEDLADRVKTVFGRPFRLYAAFGDEPFNGWIRIHYDGGQRATFDTNIAHAEIEALLAMSLPVPTNQTVAATGGDHHPLVALARGEEESPSMLSEMGVVAVADLPWAHNPARCANRERFTDISRLYDDRDPRLPSAAGAHFFLTLGPEQFDDCRYHRFDWAAIAEASIALLDQLPEGADHDDVIALAQETELADDDRRELVWLFGDPIIWTPGAPSVTNGQHRTCALKAAGAARCVALTRETFRSTAEPGDPRRRAQSVLASYWARELGKT
jgi:hypothetical protein